jgi:hypothetical protein
VALATDRDHVAARHARRPVGHRKRPARDHRLPRDGRARRAGLVHVWRGGGRPARSAPKKVTWLSSTPRHCRRIIEILGFPILHLRVASDVVQANLAAVMSLVAPDGRATFVTSRRPQPDPPRQPCRSVVPADRDGGRRHGAAQRHRPDASGRLPPAPRAQPGLLADHLALGQKAVLTIGSARLDLPTRPPRDPTRNCPNSARPKAPNR